MDEIRNAVFADIASAIALWTREGIDLLSPSSDLWWARDKDRFRRFAEEMENSQNVDQLEDLTRHLLEGCVHSILATIDGASHSAEIGRIQLVGPDGVSLGEGLHETFTNYLVTLQRNSTTE